MFLLKAFIAALSSAVIMFGIAKLLGNKQISELNMFDYINGITIGSIAAEMSTSTSMKEVSIAIMAMLVYGLIGLVISIITMKSIRCRRFFSGKALILMERGKLYEKNLKQAKLDVDDLLTKARINGYFDISQIAYAILENNGEISFLPVAQNAPPTAQDLNVQAQKESLCINIVMDGKILDKNLKLSGNDKQWLSKTMSEQGFALKEVFLATVDINNSLVVFPYQQNKNERNYFS
ncbi:MAG: DUF421 domain-containing protein [Clostridiales bacterium]|nr:DUF421 domain-containing protein [Clostridiales bacterium]